MKRYFSPKSKKVIFFDLNHTLIDQKLTYRKCFTEVLNDFTGRWDPGDTDWNPEHVAMDYEKKCHKARQSKSKPKLPLIKVRHSCLRSALQPYPFNVNEEFLNTFFNRMKKRLSNHNTLFSSAIESLDTLSKTYTLGVISNKKEVNLKQLGLSEFIANEHVITSQSGYRKPQPMIFKLALKSLKIKASEAVMVGNSWKQDIYGATRSGMDAVWIHPAHKKNAQRKIGRERVIIIRELSQLCDIFK